MERGAFIAQTREQLAGDDAPAGNAVPRFAPAAPPFGSSAEELQTVFRARLEELGVEATPVATRRQAQSAVNQLLDERDWRLVCSPDLCWPSIEGSRAERAAGAGFGLAQARWAIAETGTIVLDTAHGERRDTSLLPATGIFLPRSWLVGRLGDLVHKLAGDRDSLPTCATMITGQSASADLVGVRTRRVHGRGDGRVWLIENE